MTDAIEDHVREILRQIGEDPERDGLQRTPLRVAAQGTVFTVRLPLRQPHDESAAAGEKEVEVS